MTDQSVRIKICGLQDAPTALAAAKAGADAIGLVFAPSRRRVTPERAREICQALPPLVTRVGVFVDSPADEVRQIADFCGLDSIQLHGQESPGYCRQLSLRCIKAIPARDRVTLERANDYPVSAILVDTFIPGSIGGSGQTFHWQLLEGLSLKAPLILAGGLHPGNVGRAVALVRPYGVDVSSGVEVNGQKDRVLMKAFIQRVREVCVGAAG
ncbi:phosphoribosylanthranilate isomerase [Desulforamulus aeronauticus]|uniref:N-(5'-phosphoribosyl)anthranilate isomerase n=1 Tax=Desulforamulus aeronauticus DSM 10349 TaxID=1121421 RepID=A0A1M6R5M8_9FIRM|nr:phosphoribosylanthranilate isomerase [Desulforamulus aeronauticus]SHK27785.1 phosphoribosylanthranilate isomerase [Desulforamulus aeronauticus DSM 10349]